MTRYRAASRTRLASPHTHAKWIRVVFYLIIGRLRRGSRVRASYSLDLLREPTNFWFWLIWNLTIKIPMVCKLDEIFFSGLRQLLSDPHQRCQNRDSDNLKRTGVWERGTQRPYMDAALFDVTTCKPLGQKPSSAKPGVLFPRLAWFLGQTKWQGLDCHPRLKYWFQMVHDYSF